MNDFFNATTDEIFKSAGIEKSMAPEMYEEVNNILASKMAMLSATMGLSKERATLYDEQKKTLVDDLILLKTTGKLR